MVILNQKPHPNINQLSPSFGSLIKPLILEYVTNTLLLILLLSLLLLLLLSLFSQKLGKLLFFVRLSRRSA